MLSDLVGLFIKLIGIVLSAPAWAVILVIVIYAVLYFMGSILDIFDNSGSSESGGYGGGGYGGGSDQSGSSELFRIEHEKPEHPFAFYDSHGDLRGRGSSFYDSKGEFCTWGGGFHDGKGYYRHWGESYYDARGYFRSWGECFYDARGNLVYPDW